MRNRNFESTICSRDVHGGYGYCNVYDCTTRKNWHTLTEITGGERFTDQTERRQLLDILTEAEGHVAWPSLKFQETLKAHWGMV